MNKTSFAASRGRASTEASSIRGNRPDHGHFIVATSKRGRIPCDERDVHPDDCVARSLTGDLNQSRFVADERVGLILNRIKLPSGNARPNDSCEPQTSVTSV